MTPSACESRNARACVIARVSLLPRVRRVCVRVCARGLVLASVTTPESRLYRRSPVRADPAGDQLVIVRRDIYRDVLARDIKDRARRYLVRGTSEEHGTADE